MKVAKGGRTLQPRQNNWDVCFCLPAVIQTSSVGRFLYFTPNVSMILFFHLPMERKQSSIQGLKEPHTIIFIPPCLSTIQLSLDRAFMGLHGLHASAWSSLKYVKFYVNCVLAVLMCKLSYPVKALLKPWGGNIGLACTSPCMGMSIIRESYIKRRFSHNLTRHNWVKACWKEGGKLFFCLTVFSDMLIMAVTYRTQSVSSIDR